MPAVLHPPLLAVEKDDSRLFFIRSSRDPKRFFTVEHKQRHCMIAFKRWPDALEVSRMIETLVIHTNTWPETSKEKLVLPSPLVGFSLHHVFIAPETMKSAAELSARSNVPLVVVKDFENNSFNGDFITFTPPVDLNIEWLNQCALEV